MTKQYNRDVALDKLTILQRAYSLADRGFRLFPIRPDSKLPFLKMWPDEATTNKDTLASWFGDAGSFKDAQIGICPGEDFFVVDVDNKADGSGFNNLIELQAAGLPKTFTVKTPSGGIHLYYRKTNPTDFVISRVNWKPGIDLRGNRG